MSFTNPYQKPEDFVYQDPNGYQAKLKKTDEKLSSIGKYDPGAAPDPYRDTSGYGAMIGAGVDKLLNTPDFAYNPVSDPIYQMYADKYRRAGQQAMRDTMGQAAALTGGYGNSYAAAAGSQAYNQSLAGMNDVMPGLAEAAWQRYTDGLNQQRQNLSALGGLSDDDYSRYRDTVGDWQNNRDFGLQNWQDYGNNLLSQAGLYGDQLQSDWGRQNTVWDQKNQNFRWGAGQQDDSQRYYDGLANSLAMQQAGFAHDDSTLAATEGFTKTENALDRTATADSQKTSVTQNNISDLISLYAQAYAKGDQATMDRVGTQLKNLGFVI